MKAVLYTTQLEAITVVDIPMFLWDMLSMGMRVKLPVFLPPAMVPTSRRAASVSIAVEVFAEPLRRKNHETLIIFTHNEEDALLLKSSFLTGQIMKKTRGQANAGLVQQLIRHRLEVE